jgi:hypothetical protein
VKKYYINDVKIIDNELISNFNEIIRIEKIFEIFKNYVKKYEFKPKHLQNINKIINKAKKSGFVNTIEDTIKTINSNCYNNNEKNIIDTSKSIKSIFNNYFPDIKKNHKHQKDTKFILNRIYKLFVDYIDALYYNIDMLLFYDKLIDFKNKNRYLSAIDDKYFSCDLLNNYEKQEIIIYHHGILDTYYMFKSENILKKANYIKLKFVEDSVRIDIIFDQIN